MNELSQEIANDDTFAPSSVRPDTVQACLEHLEEIRHGKRSIGSAFRLRCTHCLNLIDRGLSVGDKCPLLGGTCSGRLELNPAWKEAKVV